MLDMTSGRRSAHRLDIVDIVDMLDVPSGRRSAHRLDIVDIVDMVDISTSGISSQES